MANPLGHTAMAMFTEEGWAIHCALMAQANRFADQMAVDFINSLTPDELEQLKKEMNAPR